MKTMIILAPGVEECEALITYDLLYRSEVDVELVGLEKEIISSHNVTIKPHKLLNDCDFNEYECLILPGGMPGTLNLENNKLVQTILDHFVSNNKLVCAICAAPSILLHKNLLKDNEFTCAPGFESGFVSTNKKAHRHNNFITGIGLGGTFEFASLIIEELKGKEVLAQVINKIHY